jgi:hypothetical protein
MGKKKDRKQARRGRVRLPKEIAGIKLPKELRKSGEALIETARDTLVREMALAGLAAMAGGAARRATPPAPEMPPAPPQPPEPVARPHLETVIIDNGGTSRQTAPIPPEQVIGMIGGAIFSVLRDLDARRPG